MPVHSYRLRRNKISRSFLGDGMIKNVGGPLERSELDFEIKAEEKLASQGVAPKG